jgi:hypothetical protein
MVEIAAHADSVVVTRFRNPSPDSPLGSDDQVDRTRPGG